MDWSGKMNKISVVVPCYNEEESLTFFYREITKIATEMKGDAEFEFLFVDDGSVDNTLNLIKDLHKNDARVRYLSFSRNFGKEAAIYAGLEHAKGNYVVIIDADLQDPPSLIKEMYHGITKEGFDCVATRRTTRKGEPVVRSFFARCFYKLMNKISKTEIVDGARDFRMMTKKMVKAILNVSEYNRFSKGIFGWVGFKTKWLEYENVERVAGKTKWSFWKLFLYSLDGIIAFSTSPLAIASITGLIFCLIAMAAIIFIIIRQLFWGGSVSGWPSLVCIIVLIGGIQLFCIGILGQYIAKTYLETKKRPLYIVRDSEQEEDQQQ